MFELLDDGNYTAGTNGSAAFTDSEGKTLLHSDRDGSVRWSSLRYHQACTSLCLPAGSHNAGNVSCSEVELRSVVVEERCMTATLILGQNVNLSGEFRVAGNGAGFSQNLSTFDFSSLNTTKQSTDVITSLCLIQQSYGTFRYRLQQSSCFSSLIPTISTSSFRCRTPRSTRPVATVPRPVMVNTSSTGIRKGLSVSR